MKLREELHKTKALLRRAQEKTDRIKKEGAPPGRSAIAYRGGRPSEDVSSKGEEPPQRRRMTAREYRKLFPAPPKKHRRIQLLHSPTPSSDRGPRQMKTRRKTQKNQNTRPSIPPLKHYSQLGYASS